jgi:hypothetical protein
MFHKLGGRRCSSTCFCCFEWRFESFVIFPCLGCPDDLRLERPSFSASEGRVLVDGFLLGGVVSNVIPSPLEPEADRSVVPSSSSRRGSLPVDEGIVFILAACFL